MLKLKFPVVYMLQPGCGSNSRRSADCCNSHIGHRSHEDGKEKGNRQEVTHCRDTWLVLLRDFAFIK